jgi:UDP-N-acetylglucosamine--N-acetylmuramyl-(pentapeptide) pyrophosphoryl-undecaprenol N-acetylglucosamine transferase
MAKVALAGGGTGGHVYPALAIGDVLRKRGHTVVYYGDAGRLEGSVAPKRGYSFRPVQAMQYPRRGILGKIRFGFGLFRSTLATRAALQMDQVDLVLGVGGYISAPPVLAAWSLGIARVVHEANVVPGLANKLCARFADRVLLTYEASKKRIAEGLGQVVVGMPVDPKVMEGDRDAAAAHYGLDPSKPVALFVGGSLGAARINELAVAVIKHAGRDFQVLHLCGERYFDEVAGQFSEPPDGVKWVGYEHQMALAYAMADLVVCRAGSSTLAELAAVGRASILIPSPHVAENHQEANARGMEEAGGAMVLVERDWDVEAAVQQLCGCMADESRLAEMASSVQALAKMDAAVAAADVIEKVLAG